MTRPTRPIPSTRWRSLGLSKDLLRFVRDLLGPFSDVATGTPGVGNAGRWVRRYLYSRVASVYGGSAQIQRNIIGERRSRSG